MNPVNANQIAVEKCSYELKIKNFLLNNKASGEAICSPLFKIDENDKENWRIKVYPRGYSKDYNNYVSVFLFPGAVVTNRLVHYQYSIINKNKIEVNTMSGSYRLENQIVGLGLYKFIEINFLKINKETLLPENNLTICCEFEFDVNCTSKHRSSDFQANTDHQSKCFNEECKEKIEISKDLGNLLETLEFTDVTLITSMSKKLKAHKAVLAARSPVFGAMFTNNMIEKLQSEIKIVDFDTEVVSDMLQFMYTGKIKNIETNSVDLLQIADKYEILGLKSLCAHFLFSTISIENAIDLLSTADQCNSEDFKTKVMKFILLHKKEIISTPKFIDLKAKNPMLIVDLFCIDG